MILHNERPCLRRPPAHSAGLWHCAKRGPGRPAHAAPEDGFTLIEIIVVLSILALMTVLVVSSRLPVSPSTHARAAAQAISGSLRSARSEALRTNRGVAFTVDFLDRSYRWGQMPPQFVNSDLRVSMLTSRDELVAESVGRIRFDPDGGSTGGRISIAGGNQVWWVGIDWLSGRVSIAQAPH
jgi:general secretion pathway protein H